MRGNARQRALYEALGIPITEDPLPPLPCVYCGCDMVRPEELPPGVYEPSMRTMDHVISRSRGGKVQVPCCARCNSWKDDMHWSDWLAFVAGRWPDRVPIVKAVYAFAFREEAALRA